MLLAATQARIRPKCGATLSAASAYAGYANGRPLWAASMHGCRTPPTDEYSSCRRFHSTKAFPAFAVE
ncbi:hypothetical protein [Kribbella catacumbae]|uniref:hypothetical protein n=1 Tax=Kribbella catacumbae TaxID=460086 RepID=UPI00036BBA30|nr:hypothetical protein [Kribbella catacumbae]